MSISQAPAKMQEDEAKHLDVSVAFPQATSASIFPPCAWDYYHFDDFLTSEEKAAKYKVREFMEKEVAPIMSKYWEKAEFPFEIIPKLGALNIAGGPIKGYGCPGLSITATAVISAEISRVDASCGTFTGVHSFLAMQTIAKYGTEAQKLKYLPSLAKLKTVACWATTEHDQGSDVSALRTTAKKVDGGWILQGQKRWIGNSTFADVFMICARNVETGAVNCFIVNKGAPGLHATKIENKMALRMVQNGDIIIKNVFVPDNDKIPGINSFQDIIKVLALMRLFISWQSIGISMGAYDMCHRYLQERQQFGAPLAAFQINQQKLVRMLSNIQAMVLMGWRLCKLCEGNKMTLGHAGMGKSWITLKARETVSLGRELLGGNGIVTDFLVAKAFCDLEPVYTYEGTYEINALITGKDITGISSFKPSPSMNVSFFLQYWEKAEFPFEIIPKLGALNIAGGPIKGFGCPGLSITATAVISAEISRVDASCGTFTGVHSFLAMQTIAKYGTEAQKLKYLPSLAKLKTVACWATTEHDQGSDVSALRTTAKKVDGGWILQGQKRWIGNSTFADVFMICARNVETGAVNCFIVNKGAPGLHATKIENKMALRMVQNGDIIIKNVFVPDNDKIPGINSFQDIIKVLALMRLFISWQSIGISMGAYDMCHRYLQERQQFGAPLAAFQINQQKLVRMLSNIQAMVLMGWRLCKLCEGNKMTLGHAGMGKSWITLKARETVSLGRELLGGNGIITDFLVAKAFCDLEPVYTYEGTYEINALITGKDITGISSFKPSPSSKRSRL